jgi:hypothetical protein
MLLLLPSLSLLLQCCCYIIAKTAVQFFLNTLKCFLYLYMCCCRPSCCSCSAAPRSVTFGQALNTHFWWGSAPVRPAEVVAEDLRQQILGLYDEYLSADGKTVRYKAMAQDPRFWEYVDATAELQKVLGVWGGGGGVGGGT